MNIETFFKLTSFLIKSTRLPVAPQAMKGVINQKDNRTSDCNLYDIYMPEKKRSGKIIIALHGISINGKEDARLMHFAQCLAQKGVICVVPNLPGLMEGDFQINDVAVLKFLIKDIGNRFCQPIGIIGFSFGGSYALLAATDEEISARIDFIVTFGACYSLKMMFKDWLRHDDDSMLDDDKLNNRIYTQLFYARKYHHQLVIDKQTFDDIELLLKRYCHEASIEEKKKFYFNKIAGLNLPEKAGKSYDENVLAYLSLDGKMNKVKTSVSLIHDKHDTLVLPIQSSLIYEELMKNPNGRRHSLLLTSLVSHVVPGDIRMSEIIGLYKSMELIFAG
jgi:hypothetical protein